MTRPSIETRILARYTEGAEVEALSISELARGAKAAYPHTHRTVTRMINDDVLIAVPVGRSLFCTPNLENDDARNMLCQAQAERKNVALEQANLRNLDAELRRLIIAEPRIIAAALDHSRVILVVTEPSARDAILQLTSIPEITFLTLDEVKEEFGSTHLLEAIFFYGYERILLSIIPVAMSNRGGGRQ